jgi:transposase-like protein
MPNVKKRMPGELKEQITRESFKEGCIVSELAKLRGVSEKTLYGWRRKYKQAALRSDSRNNFVELTVKEPESRLLKKAELIYDDFSVLLEGRIASGKLLEVIKVLEASC